MQYRRPREGPPSFLVWKPDTSTICMTRKDLLRFVKWPVKTATGDALREWLNELEEAEAPEAPEIDLARLKAEGFGPENHLDESDPNFQTRIVT